MSIDLPTGPLKFVNRINELKYVQSIVEDIEREGPATCILNAMPDSGVSRFLEKAAECTGDGVLSFLVRGRSAVAGNLFSQILLTLYRDFPDHYEEYERILNKRYGHHWALRALPYLAGMIPVAGGSAMEAINTKLAEQEQELGQFPSLIAQLTADFIAEIAMGEKVVIFIDDAQDLDPWSRELLTISTSHSSINLTYFLAVIQRSEEVTQRASLLEDELAAIGYSVSSTNFKDPGTAFVLTLFESFGIPIDDKKVSQVLSPSNGSIRTIIARFRKSVSSCSAVIDHEIQYLMDHIVQYLYLANQPLRQSDIVEVISNSVDIFVSDVHGINRALEYLLAEEAVWKTSLPDGDQLFEISSHSHPAVKILINTISLRLSKTEELYRLACGRLSGTKEYDAEYASIAYRLSKEIAPNDLKKHGERIILLSLASGSCLNAERFINDMMHDSGLEEYYDVSLHSAVLLANRRFAAALDILERAKPDGLSQELHFSVLRSICLNRVRRHEESITLVDQLLKLKLKRHVSLSLAAVKVSSLVHSNQIEAARIFLSNHSVSNTSERQYAYFIRNASAALPPEEAKQLLTEALSTLRKAGDNFGVGSVHNNLSAVFIEQRDNREARFHVDRAISTLSAYGQNNLHISHCNSGLCKILEGDLTGAQLELRKAQIYSHSVMPDLFILINRSVCEVILDNGDLALRYLDAARERLKDATAFSRMFQKYHFNALLINAALGQEKSIIQKLSDLAHQYPDRAYATENAKVINRVVEVSRTGVISKADLLKNMSPCVLLHWNLNPLELISEDVLAP
ncbi:hypothetical protein [uncultured Roseobacter sp.]|uniref:hypothetical protein n=1 Tax=uncultured Roseobacter sp. TaxID=114847 RepID=UPI002631024F|nr:hypothetical protein [uncultured Roseobacter sp.]